MSWKDRAPPLLVDGKKTRTGCGSLILGRLMLISAYKGENLEKFRLQLIFLQRI